MLKNMENCSVKQSLNLINKNMNKKRKLQEMDLYDEYENNHSEEDSLFVCDVCDFSFETLKKLNSHKSSHKKNTLSEFICEICHVKCRGLIELKNHVDSHFDTECFSCKICNFKCKLPFELKVHSEKYHSPNKTFDCDECGFKSKQASGLRLHKRSHQILICELCDFTCQRLADLKKHIDAHTQSMAFSNTQSKLACVNKINTVIEVPFDSFTASVDKSKKLSPVKDNGDSVPEDVPVASKASSLNNVKPIIVETLKRSLSNGTGTEMQTNQSNGNKNTVKNFQDIFASFIK